MAKQQGAFHLPQYVQAVSDDSSETVRRTPKVFLRIAGFLGALAVGLAAYGTHVLKPTGHMEKVYNTANLFHLLHSLLLLAVGQARYPKFTGAFTTIGLLLFCGTCYLHVFTNDSRWIVATPVGGTILLLSWATFLL